MAADLADLTVAINRISGALGASASEQHQVDDLVGELQRGIGPLTESARGLSQALRAATTALTDVDQRIAASMPETPRLSFSLPILMPPALPWPYSTALPVVTLPPTLSTESPPANASPSPGSFKP